MTRTISTEVLDVDGLDLLTEGEKEFNDIYVKKLVDYANGKADGVHIRNLTSGAATIAKRQQSRSAVAVLKWNMMKKKEPEGVLPSGNDEVPQLKDHGAMKE